MSLNRFRTLFEKKKDKVLNVYCTAGFPQKNSTMEVLTSLQNAGADIIELGMPYSDPLADGEVIQESSLTALQNGMTLELLFQQLQDMRNTIHVPIVLMGYMNPVLQYGFEKFCSDAKTVGVDGLILPDLPEYEYEKMYADIIKKNNLNFIFLITPETSVDRIKKLDQLSSGFLYAVSSSSTTGSQIDANQVDAYLKRLQSYQLINPILVGFGIKDQQSFMRACQYTNGAIIGSAYIRALANGGNVQTITEDFLSAITTQK